MGDIPAKFSPAVLLIRPIRQLLAATDVLIPKFAGTSLVLRAD
jgi:hypothetical protein